MDMYKQPTRLLLCSHLLPHSVPYSTLTITQNWGSSRGKMSESPAFALCCTGRAVLPCLLFISSVTQIALQRHHLWLFCPMPLPPDSLTSSLSSSYFCHWLFMFICFLSVQDSSHEGRIPVFAMVLKPVGEHLWNEHSTGNTHAFCSQPGCLYGSVMQKHGLFPKSKYPVLFCFCYCFRQSIFQRNFFY